jgi:putative flippase GtrA
VFDIPKFLIGLRSYLLVGAIATGVDWALFSILVFEVGMHYLLAGIVSFIAATFAGYLSGLRLVFRSGRHSRWVEISYVYLASIVGLALHMGVLAALVEWLHLHIFLAKIAASAVTFLWNFAARYFWIFERNTPNA